MREPKVRGAVKATAAVLVATLVLLVVTFSLPAGTGVAVAAAGAPVSDDFNTSSINTSLWTLYNPEGNATVSDNGSAAVLAVPGGAGEDAWTPEQAPALLQPVSNSDFSVETEFTSEVTSVSQEQGILAFGDSTDFIRFDVHTWGSSTYIYAQATIGGTPTQIFDIAITNGPDIYMRLSRSGNTWSFSYSLNGTSYTTEPNYTQALTMTEIGPYAGNSGTTASNAPAFTSTINYFHNIASSGEPVISSVASSSVTASGATVTWTTDEDSSSVVNYGLTTAYGSTATGAASVTSHSVTLSALSCGTAYDYDVSSTDSSANTNTSGNETFMTLACSGGGAPVSDDFNTSSINTSLWTLYNPEGNATVSDNGSAAVLAVPGGAGEDAWTPEQAPALLQPVSNSDFSVETEFTSEVTSVSQEQGILAFGDSTDFIRFDVHTWGSSTYIYAQATIGGTPTQIFDIAITNGPDIYMRLSRSGNTWSFSYSLNGTSYTTEPNYTQALTMTEIGPYAGNSGTTASNAPAFTSTINYFHNIASSGEPVISSVASSSVTASGATVTWTTDEDSSSVVNYGLTTAYGSTATGAASVTSHSVTLSALSCGTAYDYDVSSTDSSANTNTSGNETFMTLACSGGGAPVSDDFNTSSINTSLWTLYNPEGNATVSDNGSAAVLAVPGGAGEDAWTPEQAPALLQPVSNSDFSVETEFTSEVTSVSQEQGILAFGDSTDFIRFDVHTWGSSTYIYAQATIGGTPTQIFDIAITNGPDIYMRLSRSGNTWSFSYSLNGTSYTTEPNYTQALTMTEIGPYAGNSGTTASNAPAFTSTINYFHNIASSGEPVISSVASSSVTASGATVTWTTDEDSSSVVNYGLTTAYGSTATGAASVTSHSVTLSALSCGTAYDYDVSSTDSSANTNTSGNETFMTLACSGAPVSDDFNTSSINTSLWSFDNPEGNATVSDNGSAAVLAVPGGAGEEPWTSEQAPALLQTVSNSNFSVETEFTSEVTSVTQEQGILAYDDASDFIRFDVQSTAYTTLGGATSAEVYAEATISGTAKQLLKTPISDGADFYMRVSRSGNSWTVSYSYDGLRWTPAGSFTQAFTMTEIGPYAGNSGTTASNAPAFTSTINYFHNIAGVAYTAPPVINLWYGNNETFGENGEPQAEVNVLGDVEDVAGMSSLSYTLNGGGSQPLEMGENMYRLTAPGEFNIEIPYSSLKQGANTVVITATDLAGNISTQTVAVNDDYTGQSWPANYSVNWSTAASINSVAQVVDGNWAIEPNGTVENLDSGYDRLIDLGDMTTWQSYEATVEVTIDSLPANGGPFDIGPIVGWQGHTNLGDGQQPPDGHPFDAAFQYGNNAGAPDGLSIYANSPNHHESTLATDTTGMQLTVGTTYIFEIEATLNSGGTTSEYSFKVWPKGTTAPANWLIQAAGDPNQGSLLLWEYGYGATVSYGPVTVTGL